MVLNLYSIIHLSYSSIKYQSVKLNKSYLMFVHLYNILVSSVKCYLH